LGDRPARKDRGEAQAPDRVAGSFSVAHRRRGSCRDAPIRAGSHRMENSAMTELHFAQPVWFWTLAVLPLLAALFFAAERWRRIALNRLLAIRLQPRLAGSVIVVKRRSGFALFAIRIALALTALARPQWGFTWE